MKKKTVTDRKMHNPKTTAMISPVLLLYGFILIIGCLVLNPPGSSASEISLHGFIQGNYSFNTASKSPDNGDLKWAEERLQLKFDASSGQFRMFIKTDGFLDHIDKKGAAELREGYIDYTAGNWDTRIGRQVVTWGLGDLLFINDVFPKDFEAFFSGRPMEYLKKGVDGLKLGLYPDIASIEVYAMPYFEPSNFPDQKRFWMFDPLSATTNREEQRPSNTEFALRIYRDIAGVDASLYFYNGFYRQPWILPDNLMAPTKLSLIYPKLSVYGASLQGRALDGVLSLETGYYDSRQDRTGSDPLIPNPQTRFLIGYQGQIWEDFTAGLQYYGEYMHDYSGYEGNLPAGFPKEKRLHQLVTLRLTQLLIHQTLRLSIFALYSPSDKDFLLNPEVKYNFSDNIWAAVGANIFGGDNQWTQFGQLNKNDNIYIQARYEF